VKADRSVTVVRVRPDGIHQIVAPRPRARRLPPVEPWIPSLALAFVALALYVAALAPAAIIVLIASACTALDTLRTLRPRPPLRREEAAGGGEVVPLRAAQR